MIASLLIFALAWGALYLAARGGLQGAARDRKYKSGTGWCFWRWTDVDSEYILRLHIVKTPWFAVCLHWIRKPDAEPWLHDHPVSFLSIVLRGQYAELRATGDGDIGHKVHRWFNFVRAKPEDRHRIIFCRKNTLTLCFMGPKRREWGFHMPGGWIGWKDYYARLRAGDNMRCEVRLLNLDDLSRECDEILLRWHAAHTRPPVDDDTRAIDTRPAEDFFDEFPTEPR